MGVCQSSLVSSTKGLWLLIFQKKLISNFIVGWLECPHVFLNYNAYAAISKNTVFLTFKHRINIISKNTGFSFSPFPIPAFWGIHKIHLKSARQPQGCGWHPFVIDWLQNWKNQNKYSVLFAAAWRTVGEGSALVINPWLRPSSHGLCSLLFSSSVYGIIRPHITLYAF